MHLRAHAIPVAVIAVTALGLTGCTTPTVEDEALTLTIGVPQITADGAWDMLQGTFPSWIEGQAVYDTLQYWDFATNVGTPRLAREVTIADDRMSMEIVLRDDVDFVDGTHFDAAALKRYFEGLLASEFAAVNQIAPYEPEFEVLDDYVVEVTTVKPMFWDFTGGILALGIESPAVLDDPERARAEPLGSGPYRVGETVPEVETTLVRNPDHWDADAYPYDTVVLKVFEDEVAALNALKSGQIDATHIATSLAEEVESSGLVVHEGGGNAHMLVVWDPENSTLAPLRDKRVRQAMMLAFDREAIAEAIFRGYATVSSQAFTQGQPEWIEGGDSRYGYDPETARELLAEAGYADGFDVTIPGGNSVVEPVVQQYLGDIGIRVTFENDPGRPLAAFDGSAPLTLWELPYIDQIRILGEVFPGLGQFIVPNETVIELLEDIKGSELERSAEASQELGEYLLDEAWFIPFTKPSDLWATVPEVDMIRSMSYTSTEIRNFRPAE